MLSTLNRQPVSCLLSRLRLSTSSQSPVARMPNNTRRAHDWKAAAPAPLKGTTTFAAQEKLPRLPVPKLDRTLAELKESLKPIAWDVKEFEEASRRIDDFGSSIGPTLQQRLEGRAQEKEHWLEEWWDDLGYMTYRYVALRRWKIY